MALDECCGKTFKSTGLLKDHKATSPNHFYCDRCDLDFVNKDGDADEDGLATHKITSKDHLACPVCLIDYHTPAGRERHMRHMHRGNQEATCSGCGMIFPKASALIGHLEKNQCEVITAEDFFGDIEHKAVVNEYLSQKAKPMSTEDWVLQSSAELPHQLPPNMKIPNLDDRSEFPLIGDDPKGKGKQQGVQQPVEAEGQSEINKGFMDHILKMITENGVAQWHEFWDTQSKAYICPVHSCRKNIESLTGLQDHLRFDKHVVRRYQCPGCLRYFKTLEALTAHAESPSGSCRIRFTDQYGNFVGLATGDYVKVVTTGSGRKGEVALVGGATTRRTGQNFF